MNPQEIDKFIVFIKNLKAEKKTVFTAAHQALNCKAVEVRVVAVREGEKFGRSLPNVGGWGG